MGASKQIELSTGKKLTVDVSTLTVREWRDFWDPKAPDSSGDEVLARCAGIKSDAVLDMTRDDYRLILKTIMDLSNRPLDDPNSVSESTSD